MNYAETLDWLFGQLPMYQRTGGANYKIDLAKTHALMAQLNHPETKFKSVHIAGTNGKGSVAHMCAAALQAKGLKVGLYTSPHLKDFTERIKINGQQVSQKFVIDFVAENKATFTELKLSFFEMTVGMAFAYFAKQKVDIAVVEVGLGGRLDSTNVVCPLVSVITNIGLDHTQFLGNSLPKIAAEKGGIIKPKVPVIIGETHPDTKPVFTDLASAVQAEICFADQAKKQEIKTDLQGVYQQQNVQTAFYALKHLPEKLRPTNMQIKHGFGNVVSLTGLLGRWQILANTPKIIADTGHNLHGLKHVVQQLINEPAEKLHIVWGMVADKDIDAILAILPKHANYIFTQPTLPRALSATILQQHANLAGLNGIVVKEVKQAIEAAKKEAAPNDVIFVGGSTFVVAESL